VSPQTWIAMKQGLFGKMIRAPEGAVPWQSQKISSNIAKFLQSDLAQELYSPNERLLIKGVGDAHAALLPPPGTKNVSGSGYEVQKQAKEWTKQAWRMLGLGLGHGTLHGYLAGKALAVGASKYATRREAARAADLFLGRRRPLTYYPQRYGAVLGAGNIGMLNDQSSSPQ
jgi:hypothetical protein